MTHPAPLELSVVIPVYNEEGSLRELVAEVEPIVREITPEYEILLVNDGSTDGSADVLAELCAENGRVVVYRLDRNHGISCALHAGFMNARGRLIASLDADLQNDPADIPKLIDALEQGADLVCGWRRDRQDPLIKRISSKIANGWRMWKTGDPIHDVTCPLKAFRREVRHEYFPFNGMHRFIPTLVALAGYKVVEIPVNHRARLHGESKYGVWNRLFRGLRDLRAMRWMQQQRMTYRATRVGDGDSA